MGCKTYVVPVALTLLQGRRGKLEASDPSTGLLGVLGERKLTLVAVPGTEQVHGLAVGGSAESEVKLDSGHCEVYFFLSVVKIDIMIVVSFEFVRCQTNG